MDPDIVRELWCTHGEVPYEQVDEPFPPNVEEFLEKVQKHPSKLKRFVFGPIKKMVFYVRAHPEVRVVLLLGESYASGAPKGWQPILESRVERDRGVDPKETRMLEERLWDEICKVERRGRKRGPGRPKQKRSAIKNLPISAQYIKRLRDASLDDKDLQILFGRWDDKTFAEIGRVLRISTQATWKRWKRHIEPAIKKLNPTFSAGSFKLQSLD